MAQGKSPRFLKRKKKAVIHKTRNLFILVKKKKKSQLLLKLEDRERERKREKAERGDAGVDRRRGGEEKK